MSTLQVDVDFQGNFDSDNYTVRHTQGNNMFDPESLLTGDELARGMTYKNSRRTYPSVDAYLDAVHGNIPSNEVADRFPRKFTSLYEELQARTPRQVLNESENGV